MITQDIKNKIVEEANWRSTNGHGGVDDITRDNFILAAEYGYSLAQQEIAEAKKEIERLKGLLSSQYKSNVFHDCVNNGDSSTFAEEVAEKMWQQFKTENNL